MIVQTDNVGRAFGRGHGRVVALAGIEIAFPPATFALLQGPSGSGKTTLLNIIGGLDTPTSGSVHVAGHDLAAIGERQLDELRRTRIGFVFQGVALVAVMSAQENVEFALRVAGFAPADRAQRARECLSAVGLAARSEHRPAELSGGEQQRAAIARAMAHRPQLLLADEPTAELDTHSGADVLQMLRGLVDHEGMTVVMSSHDRKAADYADSISVLRDGRLVS